VRDEDVKRNADEKIDGRDCYVLEGKGDADSGYGKVMMFIDKATSVPMKVDYQDKDGKPFKLYKTAKLKAFKDRTIAAESTMENLQTGSKTKMEVLKLEDSGLKADDFTERALER
jgi:negative regulator of sigma E activity